MRDNGARISEGKRFPLSLSLSLWSVGPHVLSVTAMCVYSVVSWGRLSLKRCVGDGRGRVGKTLGRKPSRLFPSRRFWPNDRVAQQYCRVQPWSAVPTLAPSNQTLESPFCLRRGGRDVHPLHPPRGMTRGAHLAGQVTQSAPPATTRGPTCLAHALRTGRRYCGAGICELLPRLSVGRARPARAPSSPPPWFASRCVRGAAWKYALSWSQSPQYPSSRSSAPQSAHQRRRAGVRTSRRPHG